MVSDSVLAGAFGFCLLAVQGLVVTVQGIGLVAPMIYRLVMAPFVKRRGQRLAIATAQRDRELSLKNWEAASEHNLQCLLWIKEKGRQRFKASRANRDLNSLYEARLLDLDMSEREEYAREVHWVVLDLIWSKLEDKKFKRIRLPTNPPWDRSFYA